MRRNRMLAGVALALLMAGAVLAQPQRRHLGPHGGAINRVLAQAGVELSEEQRETIRSLVQQFREEQRQSGGRDEMSEARQAYQDAILSGNLEAATEQARLLAAVLAERSQTRLAAQAALQIQVLGVLTAGQIEIIQSEIGSRGLSRILNALTGPEGRRRPGPGGGPQPGR